MKGERIIYTTDQAPGAIPNGTLVEKCNSEKGDRNADGQPAHVLGSIGPMDQVPLADGRIADGVYGYFVEWLERPGVPVFIVGHRIRVVVLQ